MQEKYAGVVTEKIRLFLLFCVVRTFFYYLISRTFTTSTTAHLKQLTPLFVDSYFVADTFLSHINEYTNIERITLYPVKEKECRHS